MPKNNKIKTLQTGIPRIQAEADIKSPFVRDIIKRNYSYTNDFFNSLLYVVPEIHKEKRSEIEQIIKQARKLISETEEYLANEGERVMTLIRANNITQFASYAAEGAVKLDITSDVSRQMEHMYKMADRLINLVHTLLLNGIVNQGDAKANIYRYKGVLMKMHTAVNQMLGAFMRTTIGNKPATELDDGENKEGEKAA